MKILMISEYLHPQTSGITIRIEYYIKYLRIFGHQVIVYGPTNCPTANQTLPSIPFYFVNKDIRLCLPSFQLYKDILTNKYDLVHIVGPNILLFTILIYLLCKLLNIPVCTSYHTNSDSFVKEYFGNGWIYKLLSLWGAYYHYYPTIWLQIPMLHPQSFTDAKILCHGFNQGHLLSTGIDTELFSFSKDFVKKKLIYIGRIAPEKNLVRLIDLFQLIQNEYTLDIVGFGPSENILKSYVKQKQIQNINFLGRINYKDLTKYYQNAQAFVCTSLNESYGFTLLESLACGTPIIYPHCDVFQQLYHSHFPQLEYHIDNSKEFLQALNHIEENSEELREQSRKYACQYSWKKSTEDLLDIYHQIIKHEI